VERAPRFHAGASAIVDTSALPSPAPGAEIFAGYSPPHFAIEASAAITGAESGALADQPSKGAHFTLLHAGARACYAIEGGAFAIGPCASGGLEWIVANGFGAAIPADGTGRTLALGGGARAALRLTPWLAARVVAEGLFPFERLHFEIENAGQVHRLPAALFRASAGLELHF